MLRYIPFSTNERLGLITHRSRVGVVSIGCMAAVFPLLGKLADPGRSLS